MLKTLSILVVALMLVTTGASAKKNKQSGKKIAPIEVKTPARPAGQQDVVGLTAPEIGNCTRWIHRIRNAWSGCC